MEEDTPSIFDYESETSSQKDLLRRCGFALQRDHPDSQSPTAASPQQQNDRNTPPVVSEASKKLETDPDWRPDAEDNTVAVDLEPDSVDRTVHVSEEQRTIADVAGPSQVSHEEDGSRILEKPKDLSSDQPLSSGNRKEASLKSPVRDDGRRKLKIPLREVVKAIVMNSRDQRNKEEEEKIDKMSYVQILMTKGFKFPD